MMLSVIYWMGQQWVVGVMMVIFAIIPIGTSVWNTFILCDIQPCHLFPV